MKITEMILSALIKRGVLYEARNCNIDLSVPMEGENVKVNVHIEHMTLRVEKD